MKSNQSTDRRLKEIINVIISYAQLDFKKVVKTLNVGDEIDALGTGVNMLGEELNARVLSLQEKETMLKEIHHRVKNNLQIISSLLNLQVENSRNEELRIYARESQTRIKTISLIHEMLYKSPDFRYTNFKIYVTKLIDMLTNTFSFSQGDIHYEVSISDDLYFDIDTLIPIGLIINEAVSNSIKYAFPSGNGKISVKAEQKNNVCTICIQDSGVGLKKDFNEESNPGLGMHLIQVLAKQIDIEVKMNNMVGVGYQLMFSIPEK